MSDQLQTVLTAFDALPEGSFDAEFEGRRYGVTKTVRGAGRQAWFWAEERGGPDRISFNLYRLKSGAQLKPCEMPEVKVMAFVLGARPMTNTS